MLHEIGVAQIDKFIVDRARLDKKTIANHLTLLGAMLKAAQDLGWLLVLPRIRKPKVRLNADFGYLRTDEELRRFLAAAHDEDKGAFVLYAAAAYTGMRAGELAGLQWGDVNFEQRLIAVQRSYAGPTKEKADHAIKRLSTWPSGAEIHRDHPISVPMPALRHISGRSKPARC
jgi:integrase